MSILNDAPELERIAILLANNDAAKQATGATLFGPDTARWPAWWHDAVCVFERYRGVERAASSAAAK